MQETNRGYFINNTSIAEFSKDTGIAIWNLYRYAKKSETEEEMLEMAFNFKFKHFKGSKLRRFELYYLNELYQINSNDDVGLQRIAQDFKINAEHFKISVVKSNDIWRKLVKRIYGVDISWFATANELILYI